MPMVNACVLRAALRLLSTRYPELTEDDMRRVTWKALQVYQQDEVQYEQYDCFAERDEPNADERKELAATLLQIYADLQLVQDDDGLYRLAQPGLVPAQFACKQHGADQVACANDARCMFRPKTYRATRRLGNEERVEMVPGHCIADVNRKHFAPRPEDEDDGEPKRFSVEPNDDEEWEEQDYNWRTAYVNDTGDREARLEGRYKMSDWKEAVNKTVPAGDREETVLSIYRVLNPLRDIYMNKLAEVDEKLGNAEQGALLRKYDALRATKQGVHGSRNAVFRQLNKLAPRMTPENVVTQYNEMNGDKQRLLKQLLMRVYRMTLDLNRLEDMFMLLQNVLMNDEKFTDAWRSVAKRSCAKPSRSNTAWEEIAEAQYMDGNITVEDLVADLPENRRIILDDASLNDAFDLHTRMLTGIIYNPQIGSRRRSPRASGSTAPSSMSYGPRASAVYMPLIVAALRAAGIPYAPLLDIDNRDIERVRAHNPAVWDRLVQAYANDFGARAGDEQYQTQFLSFLRPDGRGHLPAEAQENLLYRPARDGEAGGGESRVSDQVETSLLVYAGQVLNRRAGGGAVGSSFDDLPLEGGEASSIEELLAAMDRGDFALPLQFEEDQMSDSEDSGSDEEQDDLSFEGGEAPSIEDMIAAMDRGDLDLSQFT